MRRGWWPVGPGSKTYVGGGAVSRRRVRAAGRALPQFRRPVHVATGTPGSRMQARPGSPQRALPKVLGVPLR